MIFMCKVPATMTQMTETLAFPPITVDWASVNLLTYLCVVWPQWYKESINRVTLHGCHSTANDCLINSMFRSFTVRSVMRQRFHVMASSCNCTSGLHSRDVLLNVIIIWFYSDQHTQWQTIKRFITSTDKRTQKMVKVVFDIFTHRQIVWQLRCAILLEIISPNHDSIIHVIT